MLQAEQFIDAAAQHGFSLYSGVPCSYLKPFINYVSGSEQLRYIPAANEGDAVAIASGAALAGGRAVAMMQNSGLGNAVNPLTSLNHTFRMPILLIITLRGEPGGPADEPQHGLMGPITTDLLELMDIPWRWFPDQAEDVVPTLEQASAYMDAQQRPFALVMRKGSVAPWPQAAPLEHRAVPAQELPPPMAARASRAQMLAAVREALGDDDVVLATTGYTGRELYAQGDDPRQLYMVGSMGCVSSLGLGLACSAPQRRVLALDGDGALLMRMGTLATLGYQRPANLLHLVLDNGCHESTGGQATVAPSLDLCAVAAACGYPRVSRVNDPARLRALLADRSPGLQFIHLPILPGVAPDLPRPTVTPEQVAQRLRLWLRNAT